MKYYSLEKIFSKKCQYNIVFGERSNGKTYAGLKYAIQEYVKNGSQTALIRRWDEDFKGKRGKTMFNSLIKNNEIKKITKGEFDTVYYYGGTWCLARTDTFDNKLIKDMTPFCYAFSLTAMEHDKSTSYEGVKFIIFDEFLSRKSYLPDEFTIFQNVLSTIIRHKKDVKILMLGNTVNQYCPYFNEMGLTNIKKMKQGDIDIYEYGDSGLRVAVEYADSPNKQKDSDVYFAFNNPKLNMIKNGSWEMGIYPHLPEKYLPKEVVYIFYIDFNGELLQGNVIHKKDFAYIYIHRKTTPIKENTNSIVYTTEYNPRPNFRRKINQPRYNVEKKIATYFKYDKVFYQDNEVGEIVRNYIIWCKQENIVNK